MGPHPPVDFVPGQARVGVAAQVPVDAAGPQVGAGQAEVERDLTGDDAHAAAAGLEDLVAHQQVFHLVAEAPHLGHHGVGLVDPAPRQIVLETADSVEVGMEPAAGHCLDLVEHPLAVAEGEEHRGEGTHLHAHVAQEQRHVGDAAELEQDGADPLGTGRGLDAHELLGGEDERHFVGEAAEPVDAVDQRGALRERADLAELLVAAVHVAHQRLGGDDLLAVKLAGDAQRAVRGGVLRADIERHVAGVELDVHPGVGGLRRHVRLLGAQISRSSGGAHAPAPDASNSAITSASSCASSSGGISSMSTTPGHGLTARASSGKSLRSGWPSNSVGR